MRIISSLLLLSLSAFSWGAHQIDTGTEAEFDYALGWDTTIDPPQLVSFTLELNDSDVLSGTDGVRDAFTVDLYNASGVRIGADSYVTPLNDDISYCNCIDIEIPLPTLETDLANMKIKVTGIGGSFAIEHIYGFFIADDASEYIDGVYASEPPVPGYNCTALDVGETYPECVVEYQPKFPPLGVYTEPDVCLPIHDDTAPTVTLGDRETLDEAWIRLAQTATLETGGVIEVPWNVDTVQCDSWAYNADSIGDKRVNMPLTIRGVLGPNGEMPRFYCRAENRRGGTVESTSKTFFGWGASGRSRPRTKSTMIEQIHVDGYGTWLDIGNSGYLAMRNNYFHHAYGNGMKGTGVTDSNSNEVGELFGAQVEWCGNEISHGGFEDNTKHAIYMGGNSTLRAEDNLDNPEDIYLKFVDNYIHSCNRSSCFKSVTKHNLISGNRFAKHVADDPNTVILETDPSYINAWANVMVDVAACGNNTFRNNYVLKNRTPDAGEDTGGTALGIVARMQSYGCNRPKGYESEGADYAPLLDTLFWDKDWWLAQAGEKTLPFVVEDNVFECTGDVCPSVIGQVYGTVPITRTGQFGSSCMIEPPYWDDAIDNDWYERNRTYLSRNTYIGFNVEPDPILSVRALSEMHQEPQCADAGVPFPSVNLRDEDLYQVEDENVADTDVLLPEIADNEYLKLNNVGDGCTGPETNGMCEQSMATYSGFTCNDIGCYGMGGGHASTQTDQVFTMPFTTFDWGELYPPTECGVMLEDDLYYANEAAMLAANPDGLDTWIDQSQMSVTYKGHMRPTPFHSYDNLAVIGDYFYEFNLKGHESSSSNCNHPDVRSLFANGEKRSFRIHIPTRKWEWMDYGWGTSPNPANSTAGYTAGSTEVDGKIYLWSNDGISVVDTDSENPQKTWLIDGVVGGGSEPSIDYGEDGDTIYLASKTNGNNIFSKYSISTNVRTGLTPTTACDWPEQFAHRGFEWDARNQVMGKVASGYYRVWDPVGLRCGEVLIDAAQATALTTRAHASHIIRGNLFIFINPNYETMAYRIPDITDIVVWEAPE